MSPATTTGADVPAAPGVPRLAAWLNRRSAGRSAQAPVVGFHRWAFDRGSGGRYGQYQAKAARPIAVVVIAPTTPV